MRVVQLHLRGISIALHVGRIIRVEERANIFEKIPNGVFAPAPPINATIFGNVAPAFLLLVAPRNQTIGREVDVQQCVEPIFRFVGKERVQPHFHTEFTGSGQTSFERQVQTRRHRIRSYRISVPQKVALAHPTR